MNQIIKAANIVPSDRQYNWQKLEFYAFIHFGMNTFTDRQWGSGKESPALFDPIAFNAEQWVQTIKDAEMKAVILTCKHHDGFCLWPSQYTEHSVKNSPYKKGGGDIVREVSDACKKYNLAFGIYLSPWDRNSIYYGDSPKYNDYFINQLTELLTNYGNIFCVWFDGACAEGANGKRQEYDWNRYYKTIRKLQPGAVINVCGPDVRWCGNEAGDCRKSEWSVVPSYLTSVETIANKSQKEDSSAFMDKKLDTVDHDLGSRAVIEKADELIWYPSEVNTSIRPNWFYTEYDDEKIRSLENLIELYINAVGGNATLLLNLPPDKNGLIHQNDVQRLRELGIYLRKTFQDNIAVSAQIYADENQAGYEIQNILLADDGKYWKPNDFTEKAEIIVTFEEEMTFDHIVLMENIRTGQRIESFEIFVENNAQESKVYDGTIIGYKKICKMNPVKTKKIIMKINESRICPTLLFFGVYDSLS